MTAAVPHPDERSFRRKLSLIWRAPRRGEWFSRWLIRALSLGILLPSIAAWFEPLLIPYALSVLIFAVGITLWWQWLGREHLMTWLAGAVTLSLFWCSSFSLWIFLENPRYRVLWLVLLALFSWWYLTEWQRLRQKLFIGEPLAASSPNLALGFLTALAFGVSAEGFLVYLNTPLLWLWLLCYVPLVLSFLGLCQLSGWSPWRKLAYPFTAAVVLAEVFAITTWWPSSLYVTGFTLGVTYLVLAVLVRQEAQGFVNRRSLVRELGALLGCLVFALLLARWV
jgi:hypothetical protein